MGLSGCRLKTLETTDGHSLLSSPKDPGGGEPSTAEEEPTFDPGYEPDWAVISTVRPRPHLAEPRRGRWNCSMVADHILPSMIMAPMAFLPIVTMASRCFLSGLGKAWLWVFPMSYPPKGFQVCGLWKD